MDLYEVSLLFIYLATYQEENWRHNGFNEESLLFIYLATYQEENWRHNGFNDLYLYYLYLIATYQDLYLEA